MAHKTKKISTLLGSALVSATALAAPKPFDTDLVFELANNPAYPLPTDEEAVMHSIVSCGAGQRICVEEPLDLNGDGHVDLVVGVNQDQGGAHKRIYLGRGNGLFNPALHRGLVTTTSGLKFADLDGDLDLDMVETVRGDGVNGFNSVYVNRNGTLESLFNDEQTLDYPFATKHDRSSSVAIGDVNGDGKLDIVIGNETAGSHDVASPPKTNYLYLNATTAANDVKFGAAIALDAPGAEAYTRRVLLVDVDNDNDLDLVATSADTSADNTGNGNVLYVNTGASPNPFAAAVPLNADPADDTDVANAIAAGDLNGDGKMDLVFSTWSRSGALGGASNRYYINSPTPGNFNFDTTGTFGASVRHTNVRIADFDNDNDNDAIVLTYDGISRLHRNTGGILDAGVDLTPPTGVTATLARGLDFADLNMDGSLDLVILNRNELGLRYLNNDKCSTSGCAGFSGPFDNDGPSIISQASAAVVPPGSVEINLNLLLDALEVNDTDNVYWSDFTAVVPAPGGGAEYTCGPLGIVPSPSPIQGTCVGGKITAKAGAEANLLIGPIDIKVRDGQTTSGSFNTFYLTVANGSPPAFITSALPAATEDAAYSQVITASDNNGGTLTFHVEAPLPTWLELVASTPPSATTAVLQSKTGTPPRQGDVGVPHTVALSVEDDTGLVTRKTFSLAVTNVNDAPTITTATLPNGTQGQAYAGATVTGSDEDTGATLTFLSTGLPSGLTMSSAGVISGTPTVSGTFTIVLTANDGTATSAPVNVPLVIEAGTVVPPPPPGNSVPVFTAPPAQSGTVGTAFNLSLAGSATDADGDILTFAASGLPPGITLSTVGLMSGSPTTASGSPFTVAVTVSDGKGGIASGSFSMTVSNPTSGGGGGGGGDSGGGGGSFGFLEVLALFGMGALATRRRRLAAGR